MKKTIRVPSKVLSLFMTFLFVATAVPFAYAADPVTLTSSNVTVWPTVSGEIYYGQKINEGITLSGGEVQYEGTVIPGHFEFVDPELRADMGIPNLKFIPDDTTSYAVSEIGYAWDLMFTINKTTPVFVDANSVPVATEVASAGTLLGKSKISGGQVMNPYYPEESAVLGYTWSWVNRRESVTKSGYYEAQLGGGMYNTITTMIYVKIAGDTPETSIAEAPTFPRIEYNPDITWADIPLTGGKAVINGNEEVAGTFTISETWKNKVPEVGSYNVSVVFTPDDLSKASVYTLLIPVTVNKGQMKFVDESGNEIVPEITVEYGTTFGDIHYYLESYVAGDDAVSIGMVGIENANKTLCKDGTYTASLINRTDSNYERTELPFKIVIKRKTLTPKLTVAVGSDGLIIRDSSGNYSPKGTFTLEYTIDGVPQEPITGIKYETAFKFNYNKSGNYEYTIIYNEAEVDEYFIIDDFTTSNPIFLTWKFSATGSVDGEYKYGDEVKLEAPATDPAKEDKPFYGFVKWEDANGNTGLTEEELSNREISFAMPDGDVDLDATYKFDFCLCIRYYIQIVVDWFNSFFQSIGTLF